MVSATQAAVIPLVLLLLAGTAHTVSAADADIGFVTYIPEDSTWKYRDDNRWPGDGWYTIAYDDSGWRSGRAYLATNEETSGEGPRTVLEKGEYAYPTYYFRRTFTLGDTSSVINMSYNIDYDDAYAVYINGRMVGSNDYDCGWGDHNYGPCKPGVHNSRIDTLLDSRDPVFPRTDLSQTQLTYLVDGTNHIAVAIKQGREGSSDAAFMLTLYGFEQVGGGGVHSVIPEGELPLAASAMGAAIILLLIAYKRHLESGEKRGLRELKHEREKLVELLNLAKTKYHHREIDEESFKQIVMENQKKMMKLELEIKNIESENKDARAG